MYLIYYFQLIQKRMIDRKVGFFWRGPINGMNLIERTEKWGRDKLQKWRGHMPPFPGFYTPVSSLLNILEVHPLKIRFQIKRLKTDNALFTPLSRLFLCTSDQWKNINYLENHSVNTVNYKKGALESQPQVIKFTSCLPMVGDSLRVLRLLPPLKLVAMI